MYRYSGRAVEPGRAVSDLKQTFPGFFPFRSLSGHEKNTALIIGPGGGRDILLALMGGVEKITAVEINPDLVDLVREYKDFNGGIYSGLPGVEVFVDEGRHFLRQSTASYDLILLSLPVTNTSRSLEGYALTENFLFTTESMSDYLDHLTDEGRLIVVAHHEVEALRLLSISLELLQQRGEDQISALTRTYIVGDGSYSVFVLKKSPFTMDDIMARYRIMIASGLDPATSFFPHLQRPGLVNPFLMALGSGALTIDTLRATVAQRGYDVSPVTDDSPFFYKLEPGIPHTIRMVFHSALAFCLAGAIVFVLAPRRHSRKMAEGPGSRTAPLRHALLFTLLGLGFMMTEITLIQRFGLFLGRPVIALVTLLGSLLTGAGLGGLWSGRIREKDLEKAVGLAALAAGLVLVGFALFLPPLLDKFLKFPLAARLALTLMLLVPPGFILGIPFPLGLRILRNAGRERDITLAWGVNGVSSVLGSSLTLVLAMVYGFQTALLAAAGCYVLIGLAFRPTLSNPRPSDG